MENKVSLEKEERVLDPPSGFPVLIGGIVGMLASIAAFVFTVIQLSDEGFSFVWLVILIVSVLSWVVIPILFAGLKAINPNEAAVYVLFGKYYGTIAKEGFYFINPFCVAINPTVRSATEVVLQGAKTVNTGQEASVSSGNKKVSLKATTHSNEKQKVNDSDGNPIDVGVVVIWRVVSATKAVFEVEHYKDYVSIQCDAALRHVTRKYPYDMSEDDEKSLRGSSIEVAEELKKDLQTRVEIAGIEVLETRISHLAYAQEIAAAMLQRQQAAAVVEAKQKIVEGAVGMVEMALSKLAEKDIVSLDDERKAAMVSNLLVVLCGNRDAQPIVNSGSIY